MPEQIYEWLARSYNPVEVRFNIFGENRNLNFNYHSVRFHRERSRCFSQERTASWQNGNVFFLLFSLYFPPGCARARLLSGVEN